MTVVNRLDEGDRKTGQRSALLSNLFGNFIAYTATGALMMLYANDVLSFSPKVIASVIAIAPLIAFLRFPLLTRIKNAGYKRVLLFGTSLQIASLILIIIIPASKMVYPLFLFIILLFCAFQQLGIGTVWQPILRDITTTDDRGKFFASMRFAFTIIATVSSAAIPIIIGKSITEFHYKVFLFMAILGLINRIFWVRKIPTIDKFVDNRVEEEPFLKRTINTIKTSKLLRLPMLVCLFVSVLASPMYVVYLKTVLMLPSNIVSFIFFVMTFGSAVSFLFWGKISDALGYRPLLTGLLIIGIIAILAEFFVSPFDGTWTSLSSASSREIVNILILSIRAFIMGGVVAGSGIAATSIQHFHVSSKDSLEAMNIFSLVSLAFISVVSMLTGFIIEDFATRLGSFPMLGGVLYFDMVKGFNVVFIIPLLILAIIFLRFIPNTKPYFGVVDFFSAITPMSIRVMASQRALLNSDEKIRTETANWYGAHAGPLTIEPLIDMLNDPSYDVAVSAIRSLAKTNSVKASEALYDILKNKGLPHLEYHIIWSLGELKYKKAAREIEKRLHHEEDSVRIMAIRALGKIALKEYIEPITEILKGDNKNTQITASACRALLRLEAWQNAPDIFNALTKLQKDEEKYEILDVLCFYLNISNEWLIKHLGNRSPYEAFLAEIGRHNKEWQNKNKQLIEAVENKNYEYINESILKESYLDNSEITKAFKKSVLEQKEWTALSLLSAAYLIYR